MAEYRTHTCAELTRNETGCNVRLSGWVHRIRDHGGLLFIDLRDSEGITQLLTDPSSSVFSEIEELRPESVISIDGVVVERSQETVNTLLPTGEIEVLINSIDVLGRADTLPLQVFGDQEYPEDIRIKYRYLDLRRKYVRDNILLRSEVISACRIAMEKRGFKEFQTPILTASSPEGARDFLVPSRLHRGKFYALPQAPQIFKQLLMVAGFDRYFQIAPCFRDEDSRRDRTPGEFYQLDMEMSFADQNDVLDITESIVREIFLKFAGERLVKDTFPKISYRDSIHSYGTDKPDLRNPLKFTNLSHIFRDSGFKIFSEILRKNPSHEVWGIHTSGGGSRSFCDQMDRWVKQHGFPGLAYVMWRASSDLDSGSVVGAGPVSNALGADVSGKMCSELNATVGDATFFVCGDIKTLMRASCIRTQLGERLELINDNEFSFCWITDFPMYERDEATGDIRFQHNPFSMPQGGMHSLETQDPLDIMAYQYDLVCNGVELASGAVRNHKRDIMIKAFEIAGYEVDELERNFTALFEAFRYGAPPHAGIAPGIERMVMLLAGTDSVRDVVLFPMNQRAEDLMMSAPCAAPPEHLDLLGLRIVPQEAE